MKKTLRLVLLVAALSLNSCGGGGGGGTTTGNSSGWTGNVNSAGYPDVTGLYSCNVVAGSAVCSDGSGGTQAPLAMNFRISQINNQVTLVSTSTAGLPAGTTILSADNFDGNVDLIGNFIIDQHIVARISSTPGNNTLTYTFTGTFVPNGWTGIYLLNIYNDFYRVSCNYTASFTGNRISQDSFSTAPPESTEGKPAEFTSIRDFTGMSSFLGL